MIPRRRLDALTEERLLDRCRRGDVEAFGAIVDAYQSRLHGFIRRMVPEREDAWDLTQEVFVKAFRAFPDFDGKCSLRTWLFRIAYRACIDHRRRADRSVATVTADPPRDGEWERPELGDDSWNPEHIVLNEELMHVVEQAIGELSEKLRTVLLLHDKEDLPYGDIAAIVGVPIGTVKSRLFLAREFVQKRVRAYREGEKS